MVSNFRNKLNFEPKQIVFVEKVYTLKTDHKTGLLLQELLNGNLDASTDEKMLKLVYGEKQYKEILEEIEIAGKDGAENYTENINAVIFATMSVLYNKPYDEFKKAAENAGKK